MVINVSVQYNLGFSPILYYLWGPLLRVPHWCNVRPLWRAGSYTGEVVLLCSGLVDDGRDHRR